MLPMAARLALREINSGVAARCCGTRETAVRFFGRPLILHRRLLAVSRGAPYSPENAVRLIALIIIVTALALQSGAMRAEDIQVKKWPADVRCPTWRTRPKAVV
jgi:hypothetical protein